MPIALRPRPELLDAPRQLPHRRVDQSIAERLRPGGLLFGIAGAPLPMLHVRGQRLLVVLADFTGAGDRLGDRHVQVDPHAMTAVAADLRRHRRTPVTTLRAVAVVTEPADQRLPDLGDLLDAPAGAGGLAGKAVARQRRADHVEGILRA